ncbi:MAG: PAS domain-containing sensor histidine kinase, partial [Nitrospinales bacterium]
DRQGDMLDAALCAVQAAWSYSKGKPNYGIPDILHPILQAEGWIVDPALIRNGGASDLNRAANEDRVSKSNSEAEYLRESEARAKAIMDFAPDGIIVIDEQGRIILFNAAAEEIFGYAADKVIGKCVTILTPPSQGSEQDGCIENYLKTRRPKTLGVIRELRGRRKDGTVFPMDLKVSEIRLGGSRLYSGIVRDITERKKAQRERLLLSRAVESSAESIMITDPKGDIQSVNPAFTAITGYAADEVIGKNPRFLKSDKQPPEFFEDLWKTITNGQVWKGDIINRKKCGSLYHSALAISPILDETGKRYGFVGVSRDVTAERAFEKNILEANAQLALARDKALEASRAKSRFLAIMSHELRTPLNAIIGYSDMLLEEACERPAEEMASDIQEIKEAGEQLLELINDTLDLSKMESGKMEINLESFNISKLVQIVVNTIFPMIKKCNNTLEVDCPPKTGSMVADITRVRQMLLNLLSNACKFTENGTISLKVIRKKRKDDKVGWVSFEIADSGIGMTEEQVNMLFEEFTQAHSSTHSGAGLGLFISRRFCRMMGGDISVKSELSKGSTFTIRLPVEVAPPRKYPERRTTDPTSF